MHGLSRSTARARATLVGAALVAAAVLAGCGAGSATPTPPVVPGTSAAPRDLNLIMRDYAYVPPVVDLVPGETVRLHAINGGLVIHEAVFGDMDSQLAWEEAELITIDAPPGPTPFVRDPPDFDGLRVVAGSGELVEVVWTVPADAASDPTGWFVGCHIPGHWAKGMVVPVRFVDGAGNLIPKPAASAAPASVAAPVMEPGSSPVASP
jgi:uncharacterized cupredoxin-like copper-binding protein